MYEDLIQSSTLNGLKERWKIPFSMTATESTLDIYNEQTFIQYFFSGEKDLKDLLGYLGDEFQNSIIEMETAILNFEKEFPKYIKRKNSNTFTIEHMTMEIIWNFSKHHENGLQFCSYIKNLQNDKYNSTNSFFDESLEERLLTAILEQLFENRIETIYEQINKRKFSSETENVNLHFEKKENDKVFLSIFEWEDDMVLRNEIFEEIGDIETLLVSTETFCKNYFKEKRLKQLFS